MVLWLRCWWKCSYPTLECLGYILDSGLLFQIPANSNHRRKHIIQVVAFLKLKRENWIEFLALGFASWALQGFGSWTRGWNVFLALSQGDRWRVLHYNRTSYIKTSWLILRNYQEKTPRSFLNEKMGSNNVMLDPTIWVDSYLCP